MTLKCYLLETGTGIDLLGQDYTKAARRAVQDAIHRNGLLFLRALEVKDFSKVHVDVTVAIPKPEAVDGQEVLGVLPEGQAKIELLAGGLEVSLWEGSPEKVVMANAAIFVSVETD